MLDSGRNPGTTQWLRIVTDTFMNLFAKALSLSAKPPSQQGHHAQKFDLGHQASGIGHHAQNFGFCGRDRGCARPANPFGSLDGSAGYSWQRQRQLERAGAELPCHPLQVSPPLARSQNPSRCLSRFLGPFDGPTSVPS